MIVDNGRYKDCTGHVIGFDYYCDIANRIVALRKEKGMRQKDLAEKCGMSTNQISDIETVKKRIWLDQCEKIAQALDVELDYLIGANIAFNGKEGIYLVWSENCPSLKIYQKATSAEMAYFLWHKNISKVVRVLTGRERAFIRLVGIPVSEADLKSKFQKAISWDEDTLETEEGAQ